MKNLPKKIYLQINADGETPDDFKELSGITWSTDKINKNDVEYVLSRSITDGSLPKTETEIRSASNTIYNNKRLTYSYREDVISVLNWVLGGDPFDGLNGK